MAVFPFEPVPLIIPSASNCLLWMRPDDTRSSNITSSAGRLSAIKNLANNRNLIRNTVTANQPGTGVATINGLNAISFDDDNNRWLTTGLPSTMTDFTFFTVAQKGGSTTQSVIMSQVRFTTNGSGFVSDDGTSAIGLVSGASAVTAPAIFAITGNVATSTRNLYKSSTTIGASGAYDGNITPTFFGTLVATSGSARGGFNMGETIMYNKVLSTAEITRIIRYLANQWGVILI